MENDELEKWIKELLVSKEPPSDAAAQDIEDNYLAEHPGHCIQILKSDSGVTSRVCHKTHNLPLVGYGVSDNECCARLLAILNSLKLKENPYA